MIYFYVPVERLEWCLPAPLDPPVWDGSLRQLPQWQPPLAEAGSQRGPKNTYLNVIVTFISVANRQNPFSLLQLVYTIIRK